MNKMKFYSKKNENGKVYHYPVNEFKKRDKEIMQNTEFGNVHAKNISYRILNNLLDEIKNSNDIHYVQAILDEAGISLSDSELLKIREYMHFTEHDYKEMTKLVQTHLNTGADEYEIENDSDVRDWENKVLNSAVLRAKEKYENGGIKK